MNIRTRQSTLTDWVQNHGTALDNLDDPSDRAIVDRGVVYDPGRYPRRFTQGDEAPFAELTVREAPDGRLLHETQHRPPWSFGALKALAREVIRTCFAGGVAGLIAIPFLLFLLKVVRGGTVLWLQALPASFLFGVVFVSIFYALPFTVGRLCYQTAQHLALPDRREVVDDVNDLPDGARTLEAIKAIKGWSNEEVSMVESSSRSYGFTTARSVLYRAPDGQWLFGRWLVGQVEDMTKDVRLFNTDELKDELLEREELELYQTAFGELPRPSDASGEN